MKSLKYPLLSGGGGEAMLMSVADSGQSHPNCVIEVYMSEIRGTGKLKLADFPK